MSDIIDDFWKKNGTLSDLADVASAVGNAHSSSGSDSFTKFGAIGALVKTIMSFFV